MPSEPPRTVRLRLAFMGTPPFAVHILDALAAASHEIVAVYSQPPRPRGRGHRTQPSAVQMRAEALGLAVRTPVSLKAPEEQAAFRALGLDAAVVAAYGLLLPRPILDAPRLGCINVHASLLPRWRGAAPIQRAILAGDDETGVTIMQMEAGLDTGPMLLTESVPITPETNTAALHDALAAVGAHLILPALAGLADGSLVPQPQPEAGVTYAAKLARDEGLIDWAEPAAAIDRKVRALNPSPGVFFQLGEDRIKLLGAVIETGLAAPPGTVIDADLGIATGDGLIRPTLLQRSGKGPVDRRAFLNGTRVPAGTMLPCRAIS